MSELDDFRAEVRAWCRAHVPDGWRDAQTGVPEDDFVAFQKDWFQQLRGAGYAVPHWPAEWGGGMSAAEQVVLYQELAAHDAPRLVLAFVSIHHAASTLLHAGTDEQRQRHLPAILDGEIWCQGFSEPEAGSDLASLRTTARRDGDRFVVNGQKLWASGARHSDWCLLLARTDPDAPKRKGISYFLLDMRSPGLDVRPIRNALGDSHFCEVFLDDVEIPEANLVGPENAGWQVAQATLSAERGLTMLELAERLAGGFRWLVDDCARPGVDGARPLDDPVVRDGLARFETELTGLRSVCRDLVERADAGTAGPADASIVKLYYSELLQRLTGFAAEVVGLDAHAQRAKPLSSGWESGAWVLDFIGSWEWTIPGGSSEIQRTIIGERGLGLPARTVGAMSRDMTNELAEFHDELRTVARDLLAPTSPLVTGGEPGGADWLKLAQAGWPGLEVPAAQGGSGASFAEVAVVLEELGRAATATPFLGTVLAVGALGLVEPSPARDELLAAMAAGDVVATVAVPTGTVHLDAGRLPFRLERVDAGPRLVGRVPFVPDAPGADRILVVADDPTSGPMLVDVAPGAGVDVRATAVVDASRSFGEVVADATPVAADRCRPLTGDPQDLLVRGALAVAVDSIGVAGAALDATVAYAAVRRQFGRPIGSFQAVKHACADVAVELTISRRLVAEAVERVVAGAPDAGVAVAMAKAHAVETAVTATGTALQLHGGIGYTWEHGLHVLLKRAALNRSLFGSPAAHRARLARRYD